MKVQSRGRRSLVVRVLSMFLLLCTGLFVDGQSERSTVPQPSPTSTPQADRSYSPPFQAGNGTVRNARDPGAPTLFVGRNASTNALSPANASKRNSTGTGPGSGFVVENTWNPNQPSHQQGCVHNTVYAGAVRQTGSLGQGAIVLDMDAYCEDHMPMLGLYLTPVRAGSLRIVDVVGGRLVLRSTDGYG